jgi:putative ABC transport system permease protein
MNVMLATVTERTREIGVRRAIGAKRMHVVGQFLTETITLSTAGGVLGILAGLAGIGFVRWWRGWTLEFSWDVALVAIAVSFVVGVLSGIFPAWRASRLDPIQALRYE